MELPPKPGTSAVGMMDQMKAIWTRLDEMLERDPEKYHKFIEESMETLGNCEENLLSPRNPGIDQQFNMCLQALAGLGIAGKQSTESSSKAGGGSASGVASSLGKRKDTGAGGPEDDDLMPGPIKKIGNHAGGDTNDDQNLPAKIPRAENKKLESESEGKGKESEDWIELAIPAFARPTKAVTKANGGKLLIEEID